MQPDWGPDVATIGNAPSEGTSALVRWLEEFGRIRLSQSFFMRDFLHSEIAQAFGLLKRVRTPTDPANVRSFGPPARSAAKLG